MFIPIGDDNRDRRRTPFINYLLIAFNIFVFIWWQDWGNNIGFTLGFSTVPAEILTGDDIVTKTVTEINPINGQREVYPGLQVTPIPVFLTLFTSMFMHGGLAHLGGNMLFLWIFGDNIEDRLGHISYLVFYLLCGLIASLCHVFSTAFFGQNMLVPSLGASGAISAVLGAYLRLFPGRSVHVWIFFFIVSVPAFVSVGLWFVFQVINGLGALGGAEAGNVAYAAHIGGFLAGLFLIGFFARKTKAPPRRTYYRSYR